MGERETEMSGKIELLVADSNNILNTVLIDLEELQEYEAYESFGVSYYRKKGTLIKLWTSWDCHNCGVSEGKLHELGCDMERCPVCGGQLISCDPEHFYSVEKGLLERIPYILIPNHCGLCSQQWPEDFKVPDEEWDKYVIPSLKDGMLCRDCYEAQKTLFPDGWRKPK